MMKKKTLLMLASGALAVSVLAACGDGGVDEPGVEGEPVIDDQEMEMEFTE
ncbi:hypothetical protein [Desertibacillus haloalkaliphilus]|uniref:hypothetical protein n=1 Tax=Desertibacillus haloalkaliphilus TaxID=1328930 RepID=UPI001C259FFB|nr:hypothetical protein [Desertibacillus haloalkaliphilus]MBU8908783.1 hypothetical protein [Desertibacillus haloalkaliphilus]